MQRELGVLDVQYYGDPVKAMQQQYSRAATSTRKPPRSTPRKKKLKPTSKPSTTPKTNFAKPAAIRLGALEPPMEPVLLVEDKPELRAMLRKALERAGYAVEEAPDGNAAIDKVRSAPLPAGSHRFEASRQFRPRRLARGAPRRSHASRHS